MINKSCNKYKNTKESKDNLQNSQQESSCIVWIISISRIRISHSAFTSPPLTTNPLESMTTSTPPALIITQSPFDYILLFYILK